MPGRLRLMIRKVTEHITAIGPLGNPKVITIYAIKDREKAIIDSGPASVSTSLLSGLREAGIPPEEITRIILTHIHIDHAGGTWSLIDSMPNAKVLVPFRGLKYLVDPTRLLQSAIPILGDLLNLWGPVKPVPSQRVEPLQFNQKIDLGSTQLTCLPAVGHAPHQMVFLDEVEGVFAADALGIYHDKCGKFTPTSPPPAFDYPQAIRDIQMIRDLKPDRVLLPHYSFLQASPSLFEEIEGVYVRWHDILEAEGISEEVERASEKLLEEFPLYRECIEPAVLRQVMRLDVGGMLDYFRRMNHQAKPAAR
jgi:glyoxylase-like metal-dependent hydrolase (beta-lactamase superfamily II)